MSVEPLCVVCDMPVDTDDEDAAAVPDGWLCPICRWHSEGRGDPEVQDLT